MLVGTNQLPDGQKGDIEVLWEDQDRINTFSKLNARLGVLEETLKKQQAEKEYLDDVSMELELVDEEEKVQYKIGDAFVYLSQPQVLERLEHDVKDADDALGHSQREISNIHGSMEELKKNLYDKFGTSINLER